MAEIALWQQVNLAHQRLDKIETKIFLEEKAQKIEENEQIEKLWGEIRALKARMGKNVKTD